MDRADRRCQSVLRTGQAQWQSTPSLWRRILLQFAIQFQERVIPNNSPSWLRRELLMIRTSAVTFMTIAIVALAAAQTQPRRELLLRCDDIGMCHSVNMALQQVVDAGLSFSASIMFTCPWYQEAVEILRGKPQVAVGIHLVLNAEWRNYRWGPVAGAHAVPSLVDSVGYFFPSREATLAHHPTVVDAERELRAQIHRALASGLPITYLDTHMSTLDESAELKDLVQRLSAEYHLPVSRSYGESDVAGIYAAPPAHKTDTLVALVDRKSVV